MRCYECSQEGLSRDAVAMCHHCSAGLCQAHVVIVDDPVRASEPICKLVILPQRARLFFCRRCSRALRQRLEPTEGAHGGGPDRENRTVGSVST